MAATASVQWTVNISQSYGKGMWTQMIHMVHDLETTYQNINAQSDWMISFHKRMYVKAETQIKSMSNTLNNLLYHREISETKTRYFYHQDLMQKLKYSHSFLLSSCWT